MKSFKVIKHAFYLACVALAFTTVSCDEEFTAIESDVLGEDNFNFDTPRDIVDIVAYNSNLEAQQINNLPSYLLGYFNDPIYGSTSASVIAQVIPQALNPDFGTNPVVTSVILTIPYFSTRTGGTENAPEYRIDSLFVAENNVANLAPIRLSVFENRFFLRDFDPNNSSSTLNYFSNAKQTSTDNFATIETQDINFDANIGHTFIQDQEFFISDVPRTITSRDSNSNFPRPAFQTDLAANDANKMFWQDKIFNTANADAFSNLGNFENFFRGIYIKTESLNNTGSMVLLNFADLGANITINYTNDDSEDNESFRLSFSGNRLNTFINNFNDTVFATNPNTTAGDAKIFLKGTEGSMGVIELFDDTTAIDCDCGTNSKGDPIIVKATALECFKKTYRKIDDNGNFLTPVNGRYELKRLINEAQLLVFEDNETVTDPLDANGEAYHTYDRLYLYNLDNNGPLIDYISDPFNGDNLPLVSRRTFSSSARITETVNGEDISRFRLRLTDHLTSILVEDAASPKLGLVLTNNINISNTTPLLNANSEDSVTAVPANTIITPRGTVLIGNNTNETAKRMRLEIFSTVPKS
jgi:hypothetical protein